MSFLDNLISNGKNLGSSIGTAIGQATNQASVDARLSSQLSSAKSEMSIVDDELNKSYLMIGRKYVEYLIISDAVPQIEVQDTLKLMTPKLAKRKELENQIIAIEKEIKEQHVMAEKAKYEREYLLQKEKLDKALSMDIITEQEYIAKISVYKSR